MRQVKSCGVILFRRTPELSFLLMKHTYRYDLPKGHIEPGETEVECALREMWEETGVAISQVSLDPDFRFEEMYYPVEARFGTERVEKTLVIFLGWVDQVDDIRVTEHGSYEWRRWNPPHNIQKYTINPLLTALEDYFAKTTGSKH
jgi:8-oxo-dGTP pyrophosphatase MutT (NUDIX family)